MTTANLRRSPLPQGKTMLVADESLPGAGSKAYRFTLDSDSVLISLFVSSTAGTIQVDVYTEGDDDETVGEEAPIISFPAVSSPTAELLLEKAALALGIIRVVVTHTAAVSFRIRAKGIGVGETSVTISQPSEGQVSQVNVSVPAIFIPAAFNDRKGLVFKNYSQTGQTLFFGFIAAEIVAPLGYPIGPGESMAIDLESGQAIWGRSSDGLTLDVRVAQAGG